MDASPATIPAGPVPALFDADFMRKLETLHLLARKLFRGQSQNDRTTLRRGMGLEFADHRRYQPGDDFRYVDWNVYSRLDRLFLKVFAAEEDLTIHLLVDTSRSMQVGRPPKIDFARRVAAALGYIGLNSLDRVGVVSFADELGRPRPPQRGAPADRRHAALFRGSRLRRRHPPEPRAAHLRAPEPPDRPGRGHQ